MLIGSLLESDPAAMRSAILKAPQKASALEVRLDALSRIDRTVLTTLFENAPRPLIAVCRRHRDGGHFRGSENDRRWILSMAVRAGAAYIDVEHRSGVVDLAAEVSSDPDVGVIVSHHDRRGMPDSPRTLYRRMAKTPGAKAVKIVGMARSLGDVLAVKRLLQGIGNGLPHLISFAMGDPGRMSRVLALAWGSWATYVSLDGEEASAPGQLSLQETIGVYRVSDIDEDTRLTGIIGTPLGHTLSPVMHNAAYHEHGLNFRYFPLEIRKAAELRDLKSWVRRFRIRGLSVTHPYKMKVMRHLDLVEPLARRIGAVNTILCDGRRLIGFNTDATGGYTALANELARQGLVPGELRMAVIGAGGAARALAHAVAGAGADVIVCSRSEKPGRSLARAVGGAYVSPKTLSRQRYDVLINCTPVGMNGHPAASGLPVPPAAVKGRLVYDVVYGPSSTPLMERAQRRGIPTLGGLEMLVHQAAEQHALFCGRDAPLGTMREAALQEIRSGALDRRKDR